LWSPPATSPPPLRPPTLHKKKNNELLANKRPSQLACTLYMHLNTTTTTTTTTSSSSSSSSSSRSSSASWPQQQVTKQIRFFSTNFFALQRRRCEQHTLHTIHITPFIIPRVHFSNVLSSNVFPRFWTTIICMFHNKRLLRCNNGAATVLLLYL
jgi:hypothetical protein